VGDVRPVYRLNNEVIVPDQGALPFMNGLYTIPQSAELLCGAMTVRSEEEGRRYDTLLTKEAYDKWSEYVGTRTRAGEHVRRDTPAIVTRRVFQRGEGRASVQRWKSKSIANAIGDLLWKVRLRTEKKKRHEVQAEHGFRKFYEDAIKEHVRPDHVAKLTGRGTGTEEGDGKRIPKPVVEQYFLMMPFLSIDEAYRKEAALTRKLEEVEEVRDKEVKELKAEMVLLGEENRRLNERLDRLERDIRKRFQPTEA
jgi:hypothetical protein